MKSSKLVYQFGNFLIIMGAIALFIPFIPTLSAELRYWWLSKSNTALDLQSSSLDHNFVIYVPKLGVKSLVISEVDPFDVDNYMPALKLGAAHALGTAFPGQTGNVYLFAHSTDAPWRVTQYNAQFYLLYKLIPGDQIYLDHQGQRFTYQVLKKQIIPSSQTEALQQPPDQHLLTLQTCWPPGTTWHRLVVIARQI